MTVEDLRNDPSRRPNALALSWTAAGADRDVEASGYGSSKHWGSGGPEDERGAASFEKLHGERGYSFSATHYDPWNRSAHDPDAGWRSKTGDFVVKSPHRAMIAGEALLRRMQVAPGGTYNNPTAPRS